MGVGGSGSGGGEGAKAWFGNLSLSWSTYFIVMNLLLILNQQKLPEHKALTTFVFPTVSYQSACTKYLSE